MNDKQIQEILKSIDGKLSEKRSLDYRQIIGSILSAVVIMLIVFSATFGKIPYENKRAIKAIQQSKADKIELERHVRDDKDNWNIVNNNVKTQNDNNKSFQMAIDNIPDQPRPHSSLLEKIDLNYD